MSLQKARERLSRLVDAQSVAIVGASDNPLKIGGRPIAYMKRLGYRGALYPVNPRQAEIQGLRAYPSLSAIGKPVDMAIVATGADLVEQVVREGVAAGVGGFVILTSGFAEVGEAGAERQRRLVEIARESGVAILGPNCLGLVNCESRLVASFTTAMEENEFVSGSFSFVSQSGALAAYWLDAALRSGIGVAKWITTGNECDIDVAAALDYLADDPQTRVIGMYVEDIKDSRAFRRAALAAARKRKPVMAIKAGRSAAGAVAAASHTGAIAGEDRVYQAFFDQFGLCRVGSLTEMLDVARLFLADAVPDGPRLGIVSVSGGAGVLLADEAEECGLEVPQFGAATREALAQSLPEFSKPANPVDVTGNIVQNAPMFRKTLDAIAAAPEIDGLVLFIGLMHSIADTLAAALEDLRRRAGGKPTTVVWIGGRPEVIDRLRARGIPVFGDIPEAVRALARAIRLRRFWQQPEPKAAESAEPPPPALRTETLIERRSKERLRTLGGIETPRSVFVPAATSSTENLAKAPLPAVAKLQSPKLLHKTDAGGVVLNLGSQAEVASAVENLFRLGRERNLPVEGVLVEEMASFEHELVLGLRRDRVFGPLLVVGRGGVEVELAPDVAMAFLPIDAAGIAARLRSLRSAPLLAGYRGRAGIDVDALARSIAALADSFLRHADIEEIEINPLVVARDGRVLALDALMTVRSA